MLIAFLFDCIWLGRWSFLLGLGELFRRNRRFRERRAEVFRLRTEVSDGQGRCPCTLQGALAP